MPLAHNLSDEEFFASYVHLFLNDDLSEQEKTRFKTLISQEKFENSFKTYKEKKGFLQLKLQAICLNEKERIALQNKIRDSDATLTLEQAKITEVEQNVVVSNLRRSVSLAAVCTVVAGFIYYLLAPPSKDNSFDALNALAYEALAMEDDASGKRLYLPSSDPEEILQYFGNSPGLDFKPRLLLPVPHGWSLKGSSVIDYDVAKIATTQYENDKSQKLFFFNLAGSTNDLPDSEEGVLGDFRYFPFASDKINIIAWQDNTNTLAMVIGRLSIQDLAKFAAGGTR